MTTGRRYDSPESLEDLEKVMMSVISCYEDKHGRNFRADIIVKYLAKIDPKNALDGRNVCMYLKLLKKIGVLENGMKKSAAKNRALSYHVKDLTRLKEVAKLIFEDQEEYFN